MANRVSSNFSFILFFYFAIFFLHSDTFSLSHSRHHKKISTLELLSLSLDYNSQRHSIIAENLANINTPYYKAKDLSHKPKSYNDWIKESVYSNSPDIKLKKTSYRHISGERTYSKKFHVKTDENPEEIKLNKNTVSLTEQSMKAASNKKEYEEGLKGYKAVYDLLNMSINGTGS